MSEITASQFRDLMRACGTDAERASVAEALAPSVRDRAGASLVVLDLVRNDEQRSLALRAVNPERKLRNQVAIAAGLLVVGGVLATVLHSPLTSLFAGRHAAVPEAVQSTAGLALPPLVAPSAEAVTPAAPMTLSQVTPTTRMGSYGWADLAEKSGQKGHYATHLATKEVLTREEQERGWAGGFTLAEYNAHLERLYAKTSEFDLRGYFDSPAGWNAFKQKLDTKQTASLKAGTMRVVDMMNIRDAGPGYEPLPTTFRPIALPATVG